MEMQGEGTWRLEEGTRSTHVSHERVMTPSTAATKPWS